MLRFCKIFPLALVCVALTQGCQTDAVGDKTTTATPSSSTPNVEITTQPHSVVPASEEVPIYTFKVVNVWPHDAQAFTQGLIFHEGALLESTGQYGESSLRKVNLQTGKVLKKVDVPRQYFAEGLTLLDRKLFQLTWTTRRGFIYEPSTFQLEGSFAYGGEGWGLTDDGESLIMSDGTHQIRFLDSSTFEVRRTIEVYIENQPLRDLNELEYVRGEIYANVWHSDRIVRIDPGSGKILGWIDLQDLLPPADRSGAEAVLNGIAYDEAGDRLFVTGKLWPKIFEIRLKKKEQ